MQTHRVHRETHLSASSYDSGWIHVASSGFAVTSNFRFFLRFGSADVRLLRFPALLWDWAGLHSDHRYTQRYRLDVCTTCRHSSTDTCKDIDETCTNYSSPWVGLGPESCPSQIGWVRLNWSRATFRVHNIKYSSSLKRHISAWVDWRLSDRFHTILLHSIMELLIFENRKRNPVK